MIKTMGLDPDTVNDTRELYGNECILRVKMIKHETYGVSNLIKRYLPVTAYFDEDIPFELIVGDAPGIYGPVSDVIGGVDAFPLGH